MARETARETARCSEELEQTALAWPERANKVIILDQESYDHAVGLGMDIVSLRKRVIAHHKPIKDAAKKAHQAAVDAERRLLGPLKEAEATVKGALAAWDTKQEDLRQEEQRKREEAQRRADEEARRAAAAEAKAKGALEQRVEEILSTPVVTAPVARVERTYEKAGGVSHRLNWKAEVTDLQALCLAVGQGHLPAEPIAYVEPNMVGLNALARNLKEKFNVPGCRAVTETVTRITE